MSRVPVDLPECRCRLEWGRRGAAMAAKRGDILVVIDVLSFCSAVATAVHHGGKIIPCRDAVEARAIRKRRPGVIEAVRRGEHALVAYSLSPPSFMGISPGTTVALPSPNGASCCLLGQSTTVYAGCLLNAAAIARKVSLDMREPGANVTILACGERWDDLNEDGCLRFAVEDYLGAGAVLHGLPFSKTPEAATCESAFVGTQISLAETLWRCDSGIELRERGYPQDVEHASMLNTYDSAAVLQNGQFESGS